MQNELIIISEYCDNSIFCEFHLPLELHGNIAFG